MNRTLRIALVTGTALTLLGGAGAAVAQRRGAQEARLAAASGDGFEPFLLRRLARELDLTAEQKSRIREVLAARWTKGLGPAADAARLARRDLRHAIQDPAVSDDDVRAAARKAAAAEETLALERHRAAAEVIPVLTPAQQAKAQ